MRIGDQPGLLCHYSLIHVCAAEPELCRGRQPICLSQIYNQLNYFTGTDLLVSGLLQLHWLLVTRAKTDGLTVYLEA
jgi:hypothetical protein